MTDSTHRRSPSAPPPGWYPDPQIANGRRFWDGTAWTPHVAPPQGAGGPAATGASADVPPLEVAGWITTVLVPPAGLAIAVVMTVQRMPRGVAMLLVSIASTAVAVTRVVTSF